MEVKFFYTKDIEQHEQRMEAMLQFKNEMDWNNYGIIWNIDHIYPLSKVDWNCIYETSKYCHYSNLQPMYIIDNIKKGNKINCKGRC